MARRWVHRVLAARIPLDRPGWEVRVYIKTWPDATSCIDIQKWVQREGGAWSFYSPAQYVQIPLPVAQRVLGSVGAIHLPAPPEATQ